MGIAHLLRDRELEVPPYQRSYSWRGEQIMAFWHDIRAAMVAEQPVYFLGTIVLTRKTNGRSIVIDGQQRLATTSMLLAAIRDIFAENDDLVSAAQVHSQYVSSTSLLTQQSEPRLLLNRVDRPAYETSVIQSRELDLDHAPDSARRLHQGFQSLKSALREDVQSAGPYWRQRLISWIQMLDVRTRVIVVSVRDDADAFLIFETLNDRGLALTVADLVKNYLFGLCRDRIPEVEKKWLDATGQFDEPSASIEFTTFLRQWWTSVYGATRERDLYRRIRSTVRTQEAAIDAIDQIAEASPLFTAMLNPEHEFWSDKPSRASESARVLLELGLEQPRPLLLAAMARFDTEQLDLLLIGLVSWSVRGLIVGGIGGGSTERYYAEAAVAVSNGRATDAESILAMLEPMIPSDRDFSLQFSQRRVNKLTLIHYYLLALREGTATPSDDRRDQLVMPVATRSDYLHLLEPDEDDPVEKRIGNYVLVTKRDAADLRRSLELRLAAAEARSRDVMDWIGHGVDERQAFLAEQAIKIWPRQPR